MEYNSILTIIGLSFDIIGAVGVYAYHLGSGKVTEQTPVEKYKLYSKISFGLILIGFTIQIVAQFFN